jgi:hypothetical protein
MILKPSSGLLTAPLIGVGIGAFVTLFTYFGSALVLRLIKILHLQTEEMIFYTSLFYAAVFFFARARMKSKMRRSGKARQLFIPHEEPEIPDEEKIEDNRKPFLFKAGKALWIGFGVVSVGWLTPALAGVWFLPGRPYAFVMLFSFIFSIVCAGWFILQRDQKVPSVHEKILLISGTLASVVVLGYLLPGR